MLAPFVTWPVVKAHSSVIYFKTNCCSWCSISRITGNELSPKLCSRIAAPTVQMMLAPG